MKQIGLDDEKFTREKSLVLFGVFRAPDSRLEYSHPDSEVLAHQIVEAVRKVWNNLDELVIDKLAKNADVSIYERGWKNMTPEKSSRRII